MSEKQDKGIKRFELINDREILREAEETKLLILTSGLSTIKPCGLNNHHRPVLTVSTFVQFALIVEYIE